MNSPINDETEASGSEGSDDDDGMHFVLCTRSKSAHFRSMGTSLVTFSLRHWRATRCISEIFEIVKENANQSLDKFISGNVEG